jgi:hypothetical protein
MGWVLYGNDLVITGSLFGVVGSAIWIKGGIFRPDLMEEVRTYSGRNPFQIKAAVLQRWDDVVAFTWLALSFLLALVGTIQSSRDSTTDPFWIRFDTRTLAAILLAFGGAVFLLSLRISKWLGMRQAVPILVSLQQEILAGALDVIRQGGLRKDMRLPGAIVSQELKDKVVADATRRLDQVGRLLEIPRRPAESDASYGERLEAFARRFPVVKTDDE